MNDQKNPDQAAILETELERQAEMKVAHNPNAKRISDCVYLNGRGYISIC